MRSILLTGPALAALTLIAAQAQQAPASGPYSVVKTATVGGEGGFDYVYADALRQSKRVAAFRDFVVKSSKDWQY